MMFCRSMFRPTSFRYKVHLRREFLTGFPGYIYCNQIKFFAQGHNTEVS